MRAKIRLRRLADLADSQTIQSDAAWSENLERMKQDYIAPREIDAQWAQVLILAAPPDRTQEMEGYFNAARESFKGKVAAVIGGFSAAAARAGLAVVPGGDAVQDSESALAYGRLATETAIRATAQA